MGNTAFLQRVTIIAWAVTPFLLALFCVMIYVAPLRIGNLNIPMPLLPFMAIYFWVMTRPQYMPFYAIFLIGLFQDALTGGPMGLWAGSYLLGAAIMSTQAEVIAGRGRSALWLGFLLAAMILFMLVWGAARLSLGPSPSGGRLGLELLITLLAYPIISRGFSMIQRATSHSRRLTVTSTKVDY